MSAKILNDLQKILTCSLISINAGFTQQLDQATIGGIKTIVGSTTSSARITLMVRTNTTLKTGLVGC